MRCRLCGVDKDSSEFSLRRDSGKYRTECNKCRSLQAAAQRYGITVGDIERLKEQQDNRCAICGIHADEVEHSAFSHNPLVVDHDHVTGKVRGLLCPNCNAGIGQFKESAEALERAIAYLRQ